MPMNSVPSWTRLTSNGPPQKCIHCNSVPTDKFITFDKTKCGENTILNQMKENDEPSVICNNCLNAIFRESLVTCLTCEKAMTKMFTLKFDMNKYSSLQNKMLEMQKSVRTNCYLYKSCHLQFQPKCTCVCSNKDVHKDICKMYHKLDYDFTCFVVSQCLGHISNSAHEDQYMCASCDKRLKETSNEIPVLPYYEKYPNVVAGAKFMKAINQRPECVHM